VATAPGKPSARFALQIIEGPNAGKTIALTKAKVVVGRLKKCNLILTDRAVSGPHALITVGDTVGTIQDLQSSHGTQVNGQRITAETTLANGDQILLGHTKIVFRALPGATPAAPAAVPEEPEEFVVEEGPAQPEEFVIDDFGDDSDEGAPSALDYIEPQKSPVMPFVIMGVVTVVLVLVFGAIHASRKGGLWEFISGRRNLLRPNHSFEGAVDENGVPEEWQILGESHQWSIEKHEKKGDFASVKTAADCGPGARGRLARTTPVNLAKAIGIELTGSVKVSQCRGAATLGVRWTSEEFPQYSYEQFVYVVAQDTDWVKLSRVMLVPAVASGVTVSCDVFGNVGTVGFDELMLSDSPEQSQTIATIEVPVSEESSLLVLPSDRGVVNVRMGERPILWNGELTVNSDGLLGFGRQAMSVGIEGYPTSDAETNSLVFSGAMALPSTRQGLTYVERVSNQAEGTVIEYTVTSPLAIGEIVPGVSFVVSPDLMASGALVLTDGKYVSTTEPLELKAAEEITWGEKGDRTILSYEGPGRLRYQVVGDRHIISYVGEPQSAEAQAEVKMRVVVSDYSSKAESILTEALDKVASLVEEKKWGEAIVQARSLEKIPLFSEDQLAQLKEQIDAMLKGFDANVVALQKQLKAGEEAQSFEDLMKAEEAIEKLFKLVEGTELEARADALEKELAATRKRVAAAFEAAAQRLADRAAEHRKKGELIIARVYLDNIMRQFPRTQVAQRTVADLKSLLKDLEADEAKRKWLTDALTDARNFAKNKLWGKAKERYQQIIDKDPNSPQAAEAKKGLAEVQAAEGQP